MPLAIAALRDPVGRSTSSASSPAAGCSTCWSCLKVGGAWRVDRVRVVRACGTSTGGRPGSPAAAPDVRPWSPSARRWCRSSLPMAAGRTPTTSRKKSRTQAAICRSASSPGRSWSSPIYVLVNVVYLRALGLTGLAATSTPAADAARRMFGTLGDRFVTAAIAISTFGFLDLAILAPTRVYYAMAADRLFFPALAHAASEISHAVAWPSSSRRRGRACWHSAAATVSCSTTSCSPTGSSSASRSDASGVPANGATASTRPPMPFRASGYPVVPILFVAVAAAVVLSVVWADPRSASRGALLLAAGVPLFYWFNARQRQPRLHHQVRDL